MDFKFKRGFSISFILILGFMLTPSILTAQNRGLVVDEKTNDPLVAVSISLNSRETAIVTNEKGEFDLKNLFPTNENDTLHFSHISYKAKSISISELKKKNYVVNLSKKDQPLGQVTVTSERFVPDSLIQYKELAHMQDGAGSLGSVLVGDKIYVIGGDNSTIEDSKSFAVTSVGVKSGHFKYENYSSKLQVYDIRNNKWKTSNLKFRKRAYHNIHYRDGKIYVLGGKRYSKNHKYEYLDDTIEIYDIDKDSILVDNTNPHQAVNFASFIYEDNIIVIGGSTKVHPSKRKEFTHKVHLLNLKTGYWYEMDGIPVDHAKETKGVIIDNMIYLIGGSKGWPLKYINTYNVSTGEYKQDRVLPYGLERPAMAYKDTVIYIFESNKLHTYNIKTKELKLYPIDLPFAASEMFYKDEMLYILGGSYSNEGSSTPSDRLYCIDLSEFERAKYYDIP